MKPDTQKRILPGKNPVLWRANKCEGEKQTKQKEPRCVHISFKVVTYLGHYNVNSYVNSPKTVFPLFCDLNFSQKNSYIHFRTISALLPFTVNATENNNYFKRTQWKYYFQEKKYGFS